MPTAAPNRFAAATTAEKLRGRYYTPAALVRLMLEAVDLQPGDRVLDPSCGDGEFLVGAVRYLAERGASPEMIAASVAGLDIDPQAVIAARERVRSTLSESGPAPVGDLLIHTGNGLEYPDPADLRARLGLPPGGRLLVLGNPPYVEAKRLPAALKADLARRYPRATDGAADLYLYFLHVALGWLSGDDRLALVLPNKCLVNANARLFRERLLDEGRLRGIDFATHADVFPDASVYPVVIHAGAPCENPDPVRLRSLEGSGASLAVSDLPAVTAAAYRATESRALFPSPRSSVLAGALEHLMVSRSHGCLGDALDVRWTISFHRGGLRERFVTPHHPGTLFARRFLGGGAFSGNGEVTRYSVRWGGWWIDYDEDRLKREGNPLPDLGLFLQPKVVICQNGRTLRAAVDREDHVLKDTFLCGVPREGHHPLAAEPQVMVGLLCSRAVHFFYSHVFHGGHVNGGYLHFLRGFLVDIPLGTWDASLMERVAHAVDKRSRETDEHRRIELEEQIEAAVSAALGLSATETDAIRDWCAQDTNWRDRERTRFKEVPAPLNRGRLRG